LAVGLLLVIMMGSISEDSWGLEEINQISFNDLATLTFEQFGVVLLVLSLLMFGSIIGGIYLAKEDTE
jgi:NADH:ubiquinone oxidoreductase subunit 6 (subunit J)